MLLAIDIGNTSIDFGLFPMDPTDGGPVAVSDISSDVHRSGDEFAVIIKSILDLHMKDKPYKITAAAVSSVVPSLTGAVVCAARLLSSSEPFIVGPGIKTGFKLDIKEPASLGADIVSDAAAALELSHGPVVICDAGTATTITVIGPSGELMGTVIMPGVEISAAALSDNAELLMSAHLSGGEIPLIGKDTDQALRAGIFLAGAMAIDGFLRNIRECIIHKNDSTKLGLIATGCFAEAIVPHCRNKFTLIPDLTLRGIRTLYFRNISK